MTCPQAAMMCVRLEARMIGWQHTHTLTSPQKHSQKHWKKKKQVAKAISRYMAMSCMICKQVTDVKNLKVHCQSNFKPQAMHGCTGIAWRRNVDEQPLPAFQ